MTKVSSTVTLSAKEDGSTHLLTTDHVEIIAQSQLENTRDSSNLKSQVLVDFGWEPRSYRGRLVAVHMDKQFMAYTLQGMNYNAVRIVRRDSHIRSLIKGFSGPVLDIDWAHTPKLMLACLDQNGNIWVYLITPTDDTFGVERHLMLSRKEEGLKLADGLLAWCPFMPEDGDRTTLGGGDSADAEAESDSRMLGCAFGDRAEIYRIKELTESDLYAGEGDAHGSIDVKTIPPGQGRIEMINSSAVTSIVVSPDGSAFAITDTEGSVKFYFIEDDGENNACVRMAHSWKPFDGTPVDTLFFLDDLTSDSPFVQFWKFALTGADGNHQLKLWSCETWSCIQSINITGYVRPPRYNLFIAVDRSGHHIFLSDIDRRALYVVLAEQNADAGSMRLSSFSQLPLVRPALSLAVIDAARKRFRPFSPSEQLQNGEGHMNAGDADASATGYDERAKVDGVRAFFYSVNSRSLLEIELRYRPALGGSERASSISSSDLGSFKDNMSDLSTPAIGVKDVLLSPQDITELGVAKANSIGGSANSITPTPAVELSQARVSPDSEEVHNILQRGSSSTEPILNNAEYMTPEVNEDVSPRPETPVAHTLDVVSSIRPEDEEVVEDLDDEEEEFNDGESPDLKTVAVELRQLRVLVDRMVQQTTKAQQRYGSEAIEELRAERNALLQAVAASKQQGAGSQVPAFTEQQLMLLRQDVTRSLNAVITSEVKKCIEPVVQHAIQQSQTQIQSKLQSSDKVLQDSMQKLIRSKNLTDSIAAGVTATCVTQIQQECSKAFQQHVVPRFDQACKNLFAQLDERFRAGASQHLESMQKHKDELHRQNEQWLASANGQVQTMLAGLEKQGRDLQIRLEGDMHIALGRVGQQVVALMQEQLASVAKEQQASRVCQPTPAPSDVKDRILVLFKEGKYNAAFETALSANNLEIVIWLCKKINPVNLFNQNTFPLKQATLLSLIQQLGSDLHGETELKSRYLEEVLLAVDKSDPQTADYSDQIIEHLVQKIRDYQQADPSSVHYRTLRMVQMAAQGLIGRK